MFDMDEKPTLRNIPLEIGDRVAAYHDGQMQKGRVAGTLEGIAVDVTFAKGEAPITFPRSDVLPLYRYVQVPQGEALLPFIMLQNGK